MTTTVRTPPARPGDNVVPLVDAAAARAVVAPLYVERRLATGEPYSEHADGIAAIVRPLRDEPDLIAAGYLFAAHDVLRDADDWIRGRFGGNVAQLVSDLRQLMRLSERTRARGEPQVDAEQQTESLRKMLLAMCNDLRVVLLRLASRLQSLRWFAASKQEGEPGLRERLARETLELYAPLANRLGIWQLKWELEDLAFRFLEPETYKRVARLLDEKRVEREGFIEEAQAELQALLASAGLRGEVNGRPKHIYSIWHKMQLKGLDFDQLFDVRALRVIVDEVAQCYQVLSLVHERFTPIGAEYDDYIAKPKANGYQSLHTVVRDGRGRPLEIQIRTRLMHELAELGLAAHWRYKEGGAPGSKGAAADDERVAWLRQLLAWRDDVSGAAPRGAASGSAAVEDVRIYVLTPQARVVELPAGATPIDFAYHVHTELGHRCRGARVDGAMAPLQTQLRTGQTVEIVAAKTGGPSRDWLNPELGYLASARSRAKVRQWFNALELEQAIGAGRIIVDKELARLGKTATKLEDLARRLGFGSVDELCVAATKEEFSLRSIEHAMVAPEAPAEEPPPVVLQRMRPASEGKSSVLVVGVDSLLTSLARCCRPVPPDDIVGFVTRGKGVSIHRAQCVNAQALALRQPERLIEVTWGRGEGSYPVDVFLVANDRQGLLRDVSEVFAREKLNVIGVNTASNRGQAMMQFTIEVSDAGAVRRALTQVAEVKGVVSARRR
ncbi:MAG: bifunctional (p)ppGpp synthetase/guanosine-3',5'-bis(diphosphate) 3'-pyrophosphohydrolase [Burkholderiales bacterium]|nr:bifunctional (p)ppGpp synthetase/guanosine-3',5'-bis(diphosphate) 3'-pyrophosphohydrolase [Burkholderiales bacterium]